MDASERRRRASEEAAEWWVNLEAKNLSQAEREAFVDWLRESAVHVVEMLRVAQVHGALEHFGEWTRIATDGVSAEAEVVALPTRSALATKRGKRFWIGGLAASVAAVAIATVWFFAVSAGQTVVTERGERREVALADGSVVQVDPETKLRIQYDEKTRRVYLDRGRALFRVAKNPQRPFLVQADDTIVRAVGTAFGVERQKEGVVVTVSEGKVAVTEAPPSALVAFTSKPAIPRPALALIAGQQVTVPTSGVAQSVKKVDSGRELAWADGRLIFDNDTVASVVEEFNRYNRVQLHVTDETLASRPVSGVFDAADPESFIAFIQTVAAVRIERDSKQDITLAAVQ
jgi:transmembrane sensor